MATPTILTLVRHGETSANLDGVWHGSTDTALTERGHRQAARAADYLKERHGDTTALYSSHLRRARDTARPIAAALGLAPNVDEGLGEYDLGSWEGKTYKELFETHRLWDHLKKDPDFAPHGGESPMAATVRVDAALRRISAAHDGERVVIVTHGGVLSMTLAYVLEGDYTQWRRVMENCAVSELVIEPEPSLLSFNHTGHLEGI
ncbi:MAG: histidine phosphatase family protein [Proteobacteria bacterium]|nr:histidine phosphatase family protein [Pseudomonadota bacterium]